LRYSLTEEHYCKLILLFGRLNATERAVETLHAMGRELGLTTNAYNTLLQSCGRNFRLDTVMKLFEEMQEHPTISPDVGTYNALILAHANNRQLEGAFGCFRMITEGGANLEPNTASYSALIQVGRSVHIRHIRARLLPPVNQTCLRSRRYPAVTTVQTTGG
jgi:pentatricopeptide repeat protein